MAMFLPIILKIIDISPFPTNVIIIYTHTLFFLSSKFLILFSILSLSYFPFPSHTFVFFVSFGTTFTKEPPKFLITLSGFTNHFFTIFSSYSKVVTILVTFPPLFSFLPLCFVSFLPFKSFSVSSRLFSGTFFFSSIFPSSFRGFRFFIVNSTSNLILPPSPTYFTFLSLLDFGPRRTWPPSPVYSTSPMFWTILSRQPSPMTFTLPRFLDIVMSHPSPLISRICSFDWRSTDKPSPAILLIVPSFTPIVALFNDDRLVFDSFFLSFFPFFPLRTREEVCNRRGVCL